MHLQWQLHVYWQLSGEQQADREFLQDCLQGLRFVLSGTKYQTEQTTSPVTSPAKITGLLAARQTTANQHGAAIADAYCPEPVISF